MADKDIHNITCSPHYQQLNGLAKQYVQLVNSLLHQAKELGENVHFLLILYRISHLAMACIPYGIAMCQTSRSDLLMTPAARIQVGAATKLQVNSLTLK